MSFEIKYDKNGDAIKQPELAKTFASDSEKIVEQSTPQVQEEPEVQEQTEEMSPDTSSEENYQEELSVEEKPKSKKPTPQESFAELKRQKLQLERERDEAIRRARELEESYTKKVTPQQQEQPEDLDINLAPDDLAEGKHLSKVDKRIKNLEKELNTYKKQTAAMTVEAKLKSQFPDFYEVVTQSNIEQFAASHPEIAGTLNSSQDLYATAVSAYKLIKKFGIYQDPTVEQDKIRVQKNAAKPRPLNSIAPQQGDSPLGRANAFADGLTDELKEQLRKEMLVARKGY